MIQSRTFVAAAILIGLVMIAAALLAAPFNASARAAASSDGVAADRIGAAFAALAEMESNPAIVSAAVRETKRDFGVPNCDGAVWPNIDAACLTRVDGAPARPARLVTIGYQAGDSTTVLMRLPAAEVAAR